MPPANDNFANAITLTGASGSITGNNIGATNETGEPPNNGHTVWYTWTPPPGFGPYIYFDTRPDNTTNANPPILWTTLQAFTNPPLGNLTEIPYTLGQTTRYGGQSIGSYIILPTTGQIWIRIDSVANTPVTQGNFILRWGPSNGKPLLGSCNTCINEIGLKTKCIDTFTGPDLTTGDIRNTFVWAVKRKNVTYPGGKYMLRYCGGYYIQAGSPPVLTVDGLRLLYHDGLGANWTFSPVHSTANFTNPGDFAFFSEGIPVGGTPPFNTWALRVDWYNGATNDGGLIGTAMGTIGSASLGPVVNPVTMLIADLQDPLGQAITGDPVKFPTNFPTAGQLQANLACDSCTFDHLGGQMSWIFLMALGRAFIPPDGINVNVTAEAAAAGLTVGPTGPPQYTLLQILPDITLVSAQNLFDNSGNNTTPKGQKNATLTAIIHNNSLVTWIEFSPWSTAATITGFLATQDPNFYPSNPVPVRLDPASNNSIVIAWNMTNPVGTFILQLNDGFSDPFPPLTITITPLFVLTENHIVRVYGQGGINSPVVDGKPAALLEITLQNIGNGATVAAIANITATSNSQPTQLSLDQNPLHFTNFITYTPNFGQSDTVNPSGNGLGWNPGVKASFEILVPMTNQVQHIIITIPFTDTGNSFPPIQVPFTIPALP